MSILNSVIKLFVGDKQQKDLKILQPVVDDVKKFEAAIPIIVQRRIERQNACV